MAKGRHPIHDISPRPRPHKNSAGLAIEAGLIMVLGALTLAVSGAAVWYSGWQAGGATATVLTSLSYWWCRSLGIEF
jgi:hypothetical protein